MTFQRYVTLALQWHLSAPSVLVDAAHWVPQTCLSPVCLNVLVYFTEDKPALLQMLPLVSGREIFENKSYKPVKQALNISDLSASCVTTTPLTQQQVHIFSSLPFSANTLAEIWTVQSYSAPHCSLNCQWTGALGKFPNSERENAVVPFLIIHNGLTIFAVKNSKCNPFFRLWIHIDPD